MYTPKAQIGQLLVLSGILLALATIASAQTWTLLPPMNDSRASFGLIALDETTVLVAGGRGQGVVRGSTEIFDIKTNTWSWVGLMNVPKQNYPLVKLQDGKLYAPSGLISNGTDMTESCEIFDPKTQTWELTTPVKESRQGSDAIVLPDGKVLIVAGDFAPPGFYRRSCDVYDPITKEMTFTDSISQGQFGNTLFMHPDKDKVIMISDHVHGANGTWLDETEEYDIATGKWNVVANSQSPHGSWMQQALQLPSGEIVAPSGSNNPNSATNLVEVYNPQTKTWRVVGTLPHPRLLAATVYLGGDSIMVIGGYQPFTKKALRECTIFNITTGESREGPLLNESRYFHRTHVVHHRDIENPCCEELSIYVFGGENEQVIARSSCEVLNVRSSKDSPLSFSPSITVQGSMCSGIDTVIRFTNDGCSSIALDSVTAEGLNIAVPGLPTTVKFGEEIALPISISSGEVGSVNGRLRLHYRSTCSKEDTSIAITANFVAATKGTIRPIISDVPNGGKIVEMPLYLVNNTGDIFTTFEITLGYDKNLLEAIAPRFDGTLAEGAALADVTTTATGATIFVPQTVALSIAKPLCILRFNSSLGDTSCTTVRLEGVKLEDATGNSCIYAVRQDSALICKLLAVKPSEDRPLCAPSISDLRFEASTRMLAFSADGCSEATTALVYDILGKQIYEAPVHIGVKQELQLPTVADGVYCFVIRNSYGAAMEKFMLHR